MSECNKAAGCLALHNAWIAFRHSLRHKPEAWISFLINSPTQNCMCTNSVIFNVLLKNTEVRVFFISIYFFWWRRGRERERGWGIFNLWPPLSSPVKDTSFSSKNKNCDPCPWHEGHIDVPNQSRGSWTLVFNQESLSSIVTLKRRECFTHSIRSSPIVTEFSGPMCGFLINSIASHFAEWGVKEFSRHQLFNSDKALFKEVTVISTVSPMQ